MRSHFGLRPVPAQALRDLGVDVPADAVDEVGHTHPYCATIPMGWNAAPALAQGAHEAVLYGAQGEGSAVARSLDAVLDPAARFSSERVPALDSEHALRSHVIVIDDLLLLRMEPQPLVPPRTPDAPAAARPHDPAVAAAEVAAAVAAPDRRFTAALSRYAAVGCQVKPSKVSDFAARQLMLGYLLDDNVLRTPPEKYERLAADVAALGRRGWAQPREVEHLVGRFTNIFLLHRLALSVFSAVYAFGRKVGHRRAWLWPSVLGELRQALALVPLVRADLQRPVCPALIQTDACDTGAAAVYSTATPLAALRREVSRPRAVVSAGADLRSADAPRAGEDSLDPRAARRGARAVAAFDASVDPPDWKVAVQRRYGPRQRSKHINVKEAAAIVDGVRWASRASRFRRSRLVLQSDSAVAVGALRKGRSSAPELLRQCRRLGAVTLVSALALELRWLPTDKNMAHRPSRGERCPGPCVPYVAPARGARDSGRGVRSRANSDGDGPPDFVLVARQRPAFGAALFWSPLLDGTVVPETRQRYAQAVWQFLHFVLNYGDEIDSKADLEYWLSYYAHSAYTRGWPSQGEVTKAVFGMEHFLPEVKPLNLARRCVRGWARLCPPQPAAPMPRDLVLAVAAVLSLLGEPGAALAVLVSFDCWLRISEVSGLTVDAVVDHRGQPDPLSRGVSVYLPVTKTGRHQAVRVEDAAVAELLAAWAEAVRRSGGRRLFGTPDALRRALARALSAFDPAQFVARGLSFTWHSLRHGGASRAHLAGCEMSWILIRGRWAVESSGRHYIQSGRQLLLSLGLPAAVSQLAARVAASGLLVLFDPAVRLRLGP